MQHKQSSMCPESEMPWKGKTAWFLTSQTISIFGSALVQFAIIFHITLQTQSGIMLTISTLCSFLPQIAISIYAGVWADLYDRKTIIVLADSLTAISTLIVAILYWRGYGDIVLLFAVSAVRAIGSGIQSPAVSAFLPQLVPQHALSRVNGMQSTLNSLSNLAAPAVSGALLSIMGLEIIFFVDVITAAIGISMLLMLRTPKRSCTKKGDKVDYFSDFKVGLRYVYEHRLIRFLLIFYAIFMFAVAPTAFLTPLMVARNFGEEVWRLTVNEMGFSVGALMGGLILSVWGGFSNRLLSISLSMITFGFTTVSLGLSKSYILFVGLVWFNGLIVPLFNTPAVTLFQEKVEDNMLGRVFGLTSTISTCILPLGMIIFGPLADIVSIESLFIVTGIIMLILGFYLLRSDLLGEGMAPPTALRKAKNQEN